MLSKIAKISGFLLAAAFIPVHSTGYEINGPSNLHLLPAAFLHPDTALKSEVKDSVRISPDAIKSKVKYSAKDSILFDIVSRKVFLFGDAQILYEDMSVKAAYIEIDWEQRTIYGEGRNDSTGKPAGLPVFADGSQGFKAGTMKYNMDTKKGLITYVSTHEGDGYIQGQTVKKDTGEVMYIKKGLYTTCDQDSPHYYIGAGKLKVIKNDKIITGPAYLVIEKVPTPLAIPFGYFPNKKGQSSGILLPTYGESTTLGFFLRGGGYYFGINEYLDMTLRGDIYSRGSWGLNAASNYSKRYRYNGNMSVRYSTILNGEKELPNFSKTRDIFVRWSHNQDPRSHPQSRFSANVNAGSSSYFRNTLSSASDYLTNTFQSAVSWVKTWQGSPVSLSVNARHSQNTLTRDMDISLPDLALNVNRRYPFKRKVSVGAQRWYEKIGMSWSSVLQNTIRVKDTILVKQTAGETISQMKNGMRHSLPVSTSFKVMNYFSLTPSLSLTDRWYLQSIRKKFDENTQLLVTDTVSGFRHAFDGIVSASLNTRLYGMYLFKGSGIKAIRHVITPTISAGWRPDFSNPKWGAYETVKSDAAGNQITYSYFETGMYGAPPSGKYGAISMGLDNNLEMKVKSKKDTVTGTKKIKLLEGLGFGTSYNMAVDSFNWSNIVMNGRTTLFDRISITFGASYDPYTVNALGIRQRNFEWDENKRPGRLVNANGSVGFNFNSAANKERTSPKGTDAELRMINMNPEAFVDFNIPWSLNVSYNLIHSKPVISPPQTTQSLNFNGDLNVTPKWKVGFSSGYDFVSEDFTYTSVSIYRDLHCWEMSFNWVPFGAHQSYNFQINVKSAVLQDLKLVRKRDWYDR